MPVIMNTSSLRELGILKFTWSSEHYSLSVVKQIIDSEGFELIDEKLIGSSVYDPLADYYLKNRKVLKKMILKKYPKYLELILYKSLLKMKESSQKRIIDYVLLKYSL
jgi:hypothetical protein